MIQCHPPAFRLAAENLPNGESLHHIFTVISAICAVATCGICLALALCHLSYYSVPGEQKLILRIIAVPAAYAICDALSTAFYLKAQWFDPIPLLVEAVAICALFELFVSYVAPGSAAERQFYFQNLERRRRFRVSRVKHDKGSLRWFRITWLCVFQYLFVSIVVFIISLLAAATQCPLTDHGKTIALILKVVAAVFVSVAITGVLGFHRRLRAELKSMGALRKLVCLKLLVFVDFAQTIFFLILQKSGYGAHDTPHLSYYDLNIGLPNTLFEMEMVIFSLVFIWAFSPEPYRRAVRYPDAQGRTATRHSFFRGIFDACNPVDIIWGVFTAAQVLIQLPFGKKYISYTAKGNVEVSSEQKAELTDGSLSPQQSMTAKAPHQYTAHQMQDLPGQAYRI